MNLAEILISFMIFAMVAVLGINILSVKNKLEKINEPYMVKLKVEVMKYKMRKRYINGEKSRIIIYDDNIILKNDTETLERYRIPGVSYIISSNHFGIISYKNWYIEYSGTLYGNGWSLSFVPVTGSTYLNARW